MKEVHAIVDLQFGSCGKGLFAGHLAEKLQPDTIVTAWGPNAGHTLIDRKGHKYVNIMLPNGIVTTPRLRQVLIGPGSVINPEIMTEEWYRYRSILEPIQFAIHEHAAVVTQAHRDAEAAYGFGIGSTMKGVGEAVISKIRRVPDPVTGLPVAKDALRGTPLQRFVVDRDTYNEMIDRAGVVMIEGAQGFSLGINHGFYPYTTSRECTIWQLLSDCAIPADEGKIKVYGVCRAFPIRVANRFKGGVQVGTSGPGYADQREIEWSDIGREPELTTVTKLPRRLFTFSREQIRQAVRANGVDSVFFNFANYLTINSVAGQFGGVVDHCNWIAEAGGTVKWLGYGPSMDDIKEI